MSVGMRTPLPFQLRQRAQGFTLVELLLSLAILAILIVMLTEMVGQTTRAMNLATARVSEFREARAALDSISYTLSQTEMDAYWAYKRDSSGNPTSYTRACDQHFILGVASSLLTSGSEVGQAMFFQAPLGYAGILTDSKTNSGTAALGTERLNDLLNCWGYYVQYNSDNPERPGFLSSTTSPQNPERKRFRLMQYAQPAESSILYSTSFALNKQTSRTNALQWYQNDLAKYSHPIAENILAIILVPYATTVNVTGTSGTATAGYSNLQFAPDAQYSYDSREFQWSSTTSAQTQSRQHQLPAMVQVLLIAADEASYDRFVAKSGNNPDKAADSVRLVLRGKFTNYTQYKADLQTVQTGLTALNLHYQVLNTTIALKAAKWVTEY
jgi:uncharacterized protein (TIGR02599 family)